MRSINLVTREERTGENPPTHEQGSDRPGRSHASVGSARSAVGQTDWHDQAEHDFLTALARRLDKAAQARRGPRHRAGRIAAGAWV